MFIITGSLLPVIASTHSNSKFEHTPVDTSIYTCSEACFICDFSSRTRLLKIFVT